MCLLKISIFFLAPPCAVAESLIYSVPFGVIVELNRVAHTAALSGVVGSAAWMASAGGGFMFVYS